MNRPRPQRRVIAALVTPLAAVLVAAGTPHDASAQGPPSSQHNHGTGSGARGRHSEVHRPAHGDAQGVAATVTRISDAATQDSPAQMAIPAVTLPQATAIVTSTTHALLHQVHTVVGAIPFELAPGDGAAVAPAAASSTSTAAAAQVLDPGNGGGPSAVPTITEANPPTVPSTQPIAIADSDVLAHLPMNWFGALAGIDALLAAAIVRRHRHSRNTGSGR
jgi:hypothetical protein